MKVASWLVPGLCSTNWLVKASARLHCSHDQLRTLRRLLNHYLAIQDGDGGSCQAGHVALQEGNSRVCWGGAALGTVASTASQRRAGPPLCIQSAALPKTSYCSPG